MITRLLILATVLTVAFVSLGSAPAEASARLKCYPPVNGVERCEVTLRNLSEYRTGTKHAKHAQRIVERLTGKTVSVERVAQPNGFYWAGKTPCGPDWTWRQVRTAADSQADLRWTFGADADVVVRVCTGAVAEQVSLQEDRAVCFVWMHEGWGWTRYHGPETFTPQQTRNAMNASMGTNWEAVAQKGHLGIWDVTYRTGPISQSMKDHLAPGDVIWIFVIRDARYTWPCAAGGAS